MNRSTRFRHALPLAVLILFVVLDLAAGREQQALSLTVISPLVAGLNGTPRLVSQLPRPFDVPTQRRPRSKNRLRMLSLGAPFRLVHTGRKTGRTTWPSADVMEESAVKSIGLLRA